MKIDLVHADDWMGLYVDGVLQYENHSIHDDELLRLCGIEFTSHSSYASGGTVLEENGRYPETLKEAEGAGYFDTELER